MDEPTVNGPAAGDRRIVRQDSRPHSTTGGAGRAYIGIALLVLAFDTVNVFSVVHDTGRRGPPIALWQPAVWEYTSGVSTIAFAALALLALRIAPLERRRWLRALGLHLVAATAFSVLHVAAMVILRVSIYAGLGLGYFWSPSDFPYELRKDLLAYVLVCGIFWVSARLAEPASAPAPRVLVTFDIVDGARTLRTPIGDIVAVRSAGNYVEFRLADGSARMMRTTLAKVEQILGAHGFVRIHRSWIANTSRLRLIEPSGSGDHRLVLDGGVEAPVSRRYPEALAQLKGATDARSV